MQAGLEKWASAGLAVASVVIVATLAWPETRIRGATQASFYTMTPINFNWMRKPDIDYQLVTT